ncbi:S8 family serine peptidase [Actinophytocola sp.]|uniref:S8 family serine peptidase n=1 Tax=Actinophytocola sp. TaxID=1872138 RepID=UPI002ED31975
MRKRSPWVGAMLAAAAAFLLVGPPGGTPSRAAPSGDGPGQAARSWVTLITGDRVSVGTTGLRVEPARRARPVPFQEFTRDGDSYVVPADAAGLIQSGLLDRELFNVTGLVRQGYDDAHTKAVPLLVQYADRAAVTRAAPPAGTTVRRALPDFAMAALDTQKTDTAQFWAGLAAGQQMRSAGVRKVWLNGKVHASLDESVPQIGAPTAWESGLTGRGVRVAVLDTGIDTDHPDLAGKVDLSKDFSGKGSVEDGAGHGTHVASTIVGSGAASQGRYKGVAPDATLAVGKVLDDTGSGSFDSIIAGMEWAAAETDAKVVNMSLGGVAGTDGTDPLSAAANTLTKEYGTLFVVAAGNFGQDGSVAAPAAADAALAVASVTKQDTLSRFSSRGPRGGDGAVKPEIAAPGDGIVAARPDGVAPEGEPVGDAYQRLSGTSMASPHMAGAAAIVAQQHPDWTPDRLKDALVSSAVAIDGAGPFGVGAGRVDLARATRTSVVATGAVSAFLPWPNVGAQKKQTVTWQNAGTEPVTLDLSAGLTGTDGQPAPAGLFALSARSVTVPAGDSASVEITVTAQDGKPGTYSGVLTATGGSVTTRTALSVRQEEEMYDVTITAVDRDGAPAQHVSVAILNLDTAHSVQGGSETYRLPRGRYVVNGVILTPRQGGEPSYTLITYPELVLDADTTQVLDARTGARFSAEPDNAAARGGTYNLTALNKLRVCDCAAAFSLDVDPRFHETFAATVPGTRSDTFAMGQARRAVEPTLVLSADDGQRFEIRADWLEEPAPAGTVTTPAVYGGSGTPEELAEIDAGGRMVVLDLPVGMDYTDIVERVANVKAAGGTLAMLSFTSEVMSAALRGGGEPPALALPVMFSVNSETAARFVRYVRAGGAAATYVSRPMSTLRYELGYGVEGQVTTPQVHRPKTRDLAEVRTAYHDNAPAKVGYAASPHFFGRSFGTGWSEFAASGQVRKEYFTPGTWDLHWSSAWRGSLGDTREFTAGKRNEISWNKAVAGPSLRGLTQVYSGEGWRPWAWRKDGVFDMALPMFGDSAGRPRLLGPMEGVTGSISLYRDGTLVKSEPDPSFASIPVPAEDGAYRLVAESTRADDPNWPLWTTVNAEWTFRSSNVGDAKALPLLTARFDPAVGVDNRAPGGRRFSFPAYVERQDGAATVTAFSAEVSYDDGRTWQPTTTRRSGDHWTVGVNHPATGYASLRATATDSAGNTVRQTVLRAYQIGG